jgi:hypothetical protein
MVKACPAGVHILAGIEKLIRPVYGKTACFVVRHYNEKRMRFSLRAFIDPVQNYFY